MMIRHIDIADLRIIEKASFSPHAGINLILGGNGAGKTSVLEAIYLIGRGRSFRYATAGPLIRDGCDCSTVVARLRGHQSSRERLIGVKRGHRTFECRLDGRDVTKRSTLAETLPVLWVSSQPQLFLDRGPEIRRRFLDTGLFHVEHDFLHVCREVTRTLKQRNASLKKGDKASVVAWDQSFASVAEDLDKKRSDFIKKIMPSAFELLESWNLNRCLSYRYRRGWPQACTLRESLQKKIEIDLKMGFTSVGPQRADIELVVDNNTAAEKTLSRGQQKILVLALHIALIDELKSTSDLRPVLLIDDLCAELDEVNQNRVISALAERSVQTFVTSIDERQSISGTVNTMFHVEHGVLTERLHKT